MRVALLMLAGTLLAAQNRLPASLAPEIYAWFWLENQEFAPEGYKPFIDQIAGNSNFGLLTTSLRAPAREVTLQETHDQIKRAVEYAHSRGLRVAFDLDVRLARGAFLRKHPDQQQWMLRVRRLEKGAPRRLAIEPLTLGDHMTWIGGQYETLSGRLLAVLRPSGTGLEEVTAGVRTVEQSMRRVAVEVPEGELYVAAVFEYRTPDSFAPGLLAFQTGIYEQYSDVPLDGVLKDEWGFPPVTSQGPREGDYWYSKALTEEYGRAGGKDFLRDAVLMTFGEGGSHAERVRAVNRYMRLILARSARIEQEFYAAVKRIFGPRAFTGTHATWGNMPLGDAFKNGYDWWQARRDYGQTDEHWPLPVRTSLAKKMGQPLWFNQFYDPDVEPYYREIWRNARAGGRVNFHPLWPSPVDSGTHAKLLQSPLMRAENRIRLLNYVTEAPLDCPVAVVFGHAAALNWTGPHFGDLGMDFAEELWKLGVRADVLPSTEIESGALAIGADGLVAMGAQRYRAVVFVNPDYEPAATFDFLRRAARSKTFVFLRDQTRLGPDGTERSAEASLVPGAGVDPSPGRVAQFLNNWHGAPVYPPDLVRLTDGSCLLARGERNPAGDEIDETFSCGGVKVTVRATGVFQIRIARGEVASLAASDLRLVEAGKFRLEPDSPTDLALWRNGQGELEGVVQGAARVPEALLGVTKNWQTLEAAPHR